MYGEAVFTIPSSVAVVTTTLHLVLAAKALGLDSIRLGTIDSLL